MQKLLLILIGLIIIFLGGYLYFADTQSTEYPTTTSQPPTIEEKTLPETSRQIPENQTPDKKKTEHIMQKTDQTTIKRNMSEPRPQMNENFGDISKLQTTVTPPQKPEYTTEEIQNMNISEEEKDILITNIAAYESYESRDEPIATPEEDELQMLDETLE